MRLLETNQGKISLTKDRTDDIPPYAILSHTWGEDDDEVTYQDLRQNAGTSKAGYKKIKFCLKQAAKDGLQYVWIDTCCIDKASSSELSEALNSMFRWYSDAAKCYVYLSDVSELSEFRESRWFTRGWTLQELLAPKSVEFFEKQGKRLGDKNSLAQQVHKITGIPFSALNGSPMSSFTVDERMSWARERKTKRGEDKAYSLMGIFGLHMGPRYGEGEEEALQRLRKKINQRGKVLQVLQDPWIDASTSAGQAESEAIFDLFPTHGVATEIVRNNHISEQFRQDPNDPSKIALTVGFHVPSKVPGYLAKFGRQVLSNDVILPKEFSRTDQLYFDLHPETKEVLLHDISKRQDTQLYDNNGVPQMVKIPRQCVVLLDRDWILMIREAIFLLRPRRARDREAFERARQSFTLQKVPEEYERTYERADERISRPAFQMTLQEMFHLDVASVASTVPDTRRDTPFEPEPEDKIRYEKVKVLGVGSQGTVFEVVDMHKGDHYACKVIQYKPIPELHIFSETAFKQKIENEVALLSELHHDHILKYLHSQGWSTGEDINIFQPICQESFDKQIENFESIEERQTCTRAMFLQVSFGLEYIHKLDIIHRDLKPSNILQRHGKYLISDFGIAKTVDSLCTFAGTRYFMAPEVWRGEAQTPGMDIYSLAVTVLQALEGFPEKMPDAQEEWHRYFQGRACERTLIKRMLADDPKKRPKAHEIIDTLSFDPLGRLRQSSLDTLQGDAISRGEQSDIPRTKPAKLAKPADKQRKKDLKLGSSQKGRSAGSQSARVGKRRRAKLKRARGKLQGRRLPD